MLGADILEHVVQAVGGQGLPSLDQGLAGGMQPQRDMLREVGRPFHDGVGDFAAPVVPLDRAEASAVQVSAPAWAFPVQIQLVAGAVNDLPRLARLQQVNVVDASHVQSADPQSMLPVGHMAQGVGQTKQ